MYQRPVATAAAPSSSTGRIIASPLAKKLAAEKGIDLAQDSREQVMHGRIIKRDIDNFQPQARWGGTAVCPQKVRNRLLKLPIRKCVKRLQKDVCRHLNFQHLITT